MLKSALDEEHAAVNALEEGALDERALPAVNTIGAARDGTSGLLDWAAPADQGASGLPD